VIHKFNGVGHRLLILGLHIMKAEKPDERAADCTRLESLTELRRKPRSLTRAVQ
jgi:hypothetical protein